MKRIEVPSTERDLIEKYFTSEFIKLIDDAEIIYGEFHPVDLYFLASNALDALLAVRRFNG